MTRFIALLCCFVVPSIAHAWLESGHHVIAVLAFESMSDEDQTEVLRILAQHPQYGEHFTPPDELTDQAAIDRWRIGTAGYWPDIIRGTDYDRPTWHYQRAADYVIGNVDVPDPPDDLPPAATLQTRELYIAQAVELCLRVYRDPAQPDADRAIALCWLLHLFADGHLPCHAGSLYASRIFPEGDQGANSIKLPEGTLHFAWDSLLGQIATPADVRRRVLELGDIRAELPPNETDLVAWTSAKTWLAESAALAKTHLYTDEVTGPVIAASRGLVDELPILKLSEDYYRAAGEAAAGRAKLAALRLSLVLANRRP